MTLLISSSAFAGKWTICQYGGGESSCKEITNEADCTAKLTEKFKTDKSLQFKRFANSETVSKTYKQYYCKEVLNKDQWMKYTIFVETNYAGKNKGTTGKANCFTTVKQGNANIGELCIKRIRTSSSKQFIGADKEKVSYSQKKEFVILKTSECKKEKLGKSCRGKITQPEADRFRKGDFQLESYNGTNGVSSDDQLHHGTCRAFADIGFRCSLSIGELREQWAKARKEVGADKFQKGNKEYDALKITWDDVNFLIEGEQ